MENKITVVFMVMENGKVLVEKRLPNQVLPNALLFPGGKVEKNELSDLESALKRELGEELGIKPKDFHIIPCNDIYGPAGALLKPFLIHSWEGIIPQKVLDKGNPLYWTNIEVMLNSPIDAIKELTLALKRFIDTHHDPSKP